MRTGKRSKGGCWTCKLRKKKCDESYPTCSICQALKINCYGYGERPSWMTNSMQQRKVVLELRQRVKETLSQNRKLRHSNCITTSVDGPDGRGQQHSRTQGMGGHFSLHDGAVSSAHNNSPELAASSVPLRDIPESTIDPSFWNTIHLPYQVDIDEEEANLWMHYLDKTFPHQFPFYKPTAREGGRGWLWVLAKQTEPLYHALLAIAAYHQHYLLICEGGSSEDLEGSPSTDEQLRRYNLALVKLQDYLRESISGERRMSKPACLRLLACIVFLISLEVFKSTGSAWRVHFNAAASLLPRMTTTCVQYPEELVGTQIHAWKFVAGTLAWYDVLSCISPTPPLCVPTGWMWCGTGFMSQDRIMGCETWAMSSIRDIVALRTWKNDMQVKGSLSLRDLGHRAAEIEQSLEQGLQIVTTMATDTEQPSDDFLVATEMHDYGSKHVSLLVTRIFASAALTYLFATVSSLNPKLSEIQGSIARTLAAIRVLPHLRFLCSLSWPLYVTGCLAVGESREIFKDIMQRYNKKPHDFGSSQHIFTIVKKHWDLQEEGVDFSQNLDWTSAMKSLDLDLLLV